MQSSAQGSLFARARACLDCPDPQIKVALTEAAAVDFGRGLMTLESAELPLAIGDPGRPARPQLVEPRQVPQRGVGTLEGRARLIHAIAHIEFNAINLAWDAVYRFRCMPADFYADWVAVARDEARHFTLLSARLRTLGSQYGDFDAHDGLWQMARLSADDCLARMALVPRMLEARGLDVTPALITRLRGVGDTESAEILELILREEVAHVAAGSRWFTFCCDRAGVDPSATFEKLLRENLRGGLKGPLNGPARLAAGFAPAELARLTEMANGGA